MLFDKVVKKDVYEALNDFKTFGYPSDYSSSTSYDVFVKGKPYPPKAIMAYAYKRVHGHLPEKFKGGRNTDCFKRYWELGFQVTRKIKEWVDFSESELTHLINAIEKRFEYSTHIENKYELDYALYTIGEVIKNSSIQSSSARMAIIRGSTFMLELNGRWLFSLSRRDWENFEYKLMLPREIDLSGLNVFKREEFKESAKDLVTLRVKSLKDISEHVLKGLEQCAREEVEEWGESNLSMIRKAASTTNKALKLMVFNDLSVHELKVIKEEMIAEKHDIQFYSSDDIDLLQKYARKKKNSSKEHRQAYEDLTEIYKKTEYWTKSVAENIPDIKNWKVRKAPINQGQIFEYYQWGKLYPYPDVTLNFAITLVLDADGFFQVKIDTVGLLDTDPLRKKYLKRRGDIRSSDIVLFHKAEEILRLGWSGLIKLTTENIKQLIPRLNEILVEFGITGEYNLGNHKRMTRNTKPVNKILYGPPGTGKTHALKNRYLPNYEESGYHPDDNHLLQEIVKDLSWWHVIGVALLDENEAITVPRLVENRWIEAFNSLKEVKNISSSVWNSLQSHSTKSDNRVNYSRSHYPSIFKKDNDSKWSILEGVVKRDCPDLIDIKLKFDRRDGLKLGGETLSRFCFTTFHQSYSYEDFIEGIKPIMDNNEDGEIRYRIERGVFMKLCEEAEKDPDNRYAIFIDEINRGNIANIFGELITLIETNKRTGMDDAISITLPYSKKRFSVPPNVDIYGTMNTADRSIEALDSALRRRFVFEELMPNPGLLDEMLPDDIKNWQGIPLSKVLSIINERLEVLIDRDHQIGHAYFLKLKSAEDAKEGIRKVFADEIVPLLQEYFYNDYVKIGMVLGTGFLDIIKPVPNDLFADIKGGVPSDYTGEPIYKLHPLLKTSEFDLEGALRILLKEPANEEE